MRKILAILTAVMMLTASAALGEALPASVSGEFSGTAKGFGGDVTITLTLTDGEITAAVAQGENESEGIGSVAVEKLPAQMAETGSIAVDAIGGATISSSAVVEAAKAALVAAGLNPRTMPPRVKRAPARTCCAAATS